VRRTTWWLCAGLAAFASLLGCSDSSSSVAGADTDAGQEVTGLRTDTGSPETVDTRVPEDLSVDAPALPDARSDDAVPADPSFVVTALDIDGSGVEATVEAGCIVPFILAWTLCADDECEDCQRVLLVGVEDTVTACIDAGKPSACPAMTPDVDLGTLEAPAEPGKAGVYAMVLSDATCADAAPVFSDAGTKVKIGSLDVAPPCLPLTCDTLGKACGKWDDSCGATLFCGSCPDGSECSPGGVCTPVSACTGDIFEVSDAYIGGYGNTAVVQPGAEVLVLLSWKLGSSLEHAGASRQVVVGAEKTPSLCIDVAPPDCPAVAGGMGSGNITAPSLPGTYAVYAAVLAEEDCDAVSGAAFAAADRVAIGSLEVSGSCVPATCTSLKHECGFPEDGCGGLLHCGVCPPSEACGADGTCGVQAYCGDGLFELLLAKLSPTGNTATVLPGDNVPLVLQWRLGGIPGEPQTPLQVVAGIDNAPGFCVERVPSQTCPSYELGAGWGFLHAPDATGLHTVEVAALTESSCDAALAAFPAAAKVPAGVVTVFGECSPSTCAQMGKKCGTWGDGCGGTIPCGACPEGMSCSATGQCQGQCTDGIFEIPTVSLNASGSAASAGAGKTFPAWLAYDVGNPDGCKDCMRQLVVGVGKTPGFCTDLGVPPACPASTSGSANGTLKAPVLPGSYPITAALTTQSGCAAAMDAFASDPAAKTVGSLQVPAGGCQPKSCAAQNKDCGAWDDGCGFEITCGDCSSPDICVASGKCSCPAVDAFEPNNTPSDAWYLGAFTDHDGSSTQKLVGTLANEQDWFSLDSSDVQWAFLEPVVQADLYAQTPFALTVVYLCLDGSLPDPKLLDGNGCQWTESIPFASVPAAPDPVAGYVCQSAGQPLLLKFAPKCGFLDDSGKMFVGIEAKGSCSGYTVDLHL
jgi:hypothetical protein